jgi:alkylated DNA repair dioxygenase AlkB
MAVMQPSLLDGSLAGEGGIRLPHPSRVHLAHGAWFDYEANWLSGSAQLFDRLRDGVPWRAERRRMFDRELAVPRLVAFYDQGPFPAPALEQILRTLNRHYSDQNQEPFRTVGLCLYRDGQDSVAWHGDRIGRGRTEDTAVAIVSIGSPRRFSLRPAGGGKSLRFELGHGDLFVMGGSCQRTWEHSVPKSTAARGPRISVQFRPHGVR